MEHNQTINAAFADLSLSAEIIAELQTYLLAAANYYHLIPIEKLYSIICEQNPELLSKEDFLSFLGIQKVQPTPYQILKPGELFEGVPTKLNQLWNGMLVHECLLIDQDECYAFIEFSEGKPYHVPEKEQFLQYAEDCFYVETPEITAMRAVFADMGMSAAKQENELQNVLIFAQENADFSEIFDDIQRRKVAFNDRTIRKFVRAYRNLHNHIPLPLIHGCTPVELLEVFPEMPGEVLYWTEDVYKTPEIQKRMEQLVSAAATQPKQSLADFMQSQIDLKKMLEDVPGQLPS